MRGCRLGCPQTFIRPVPSLKARGLLSQKDKAYKFAIRIVNAYRYLCETKKEFVLSKQLLRSGTSIGANVAEAQGAIFQADFRAKISIAYKECLETKYWLSLLKDTGYINEKAFNSIDNDAQEISKMLWNIIKTTNSKLNR